jgi:hypothetical protein
MTPDQQFILAILAAMVPLLGALAAVFVQIRQLKLHVNSRMDQLLELTKTASKAEGDLAATQRLGSEPPPRTKFPE